MANQKRIALLLVLWMLFSLVSVPGVTAAAETDANGGYTYYAPQDADISNGIKKEETVPGIPMTLPGLLPFSQ